MRNTTSNHRTTSNHTVAKTVAAGTLGLGALAAFPALAHAQTPDTGSTQALPQGSAGATTDLQVDAGSLTIGVNLDASAPDTGSLQFGSLDISPNTGSQGVDQGSNPGSTTVSPGSSALPGSSTTPTTPAAPSSPSGSLSGLPMDAGSLMGAANGMLDTGSLTAQLSGLSSGA